MQQISPRRIFKLAADPSEADYATAVSQYLLHYSIHDSDFSPNCLVYIRVVSLAVAPNQRVGSVASMYREDLLHYRPASVCCLERGEDSTSWQEASLILYPVVIQIS